MSIVEYDMTRLSSNQLESLAISVKNELAARHEKVRRAKADAIIDIRNALNVPLDDGLASPSDFAEAVVNDPAKFYNIIARLLENSRG